MIIGTCWHPPADLLTLPLTLKGDYLETYFQGFSPKSLLWRTSVASPESLQIYFQTQNMYQHLNKVLSFYFFTCTGRRRGLPVVWSVCWNDGIKSLKESHTAGTVPSGSGNGDEWEWNCSWVIDEVPNFLGDFLEFGLASCCKQRGAAWLQGCR